MWNPSPVVGYAMRAAGPFDRISPRAADWQLTPATDVGRVVKGMPRVNLLLVGVHREMWRSLREQLLDLREPIVSWSPGQRLGYPSATEVGTLILHDVDALSADDQRHLLEWLEPAGRFVRIISTTSEPLFPRVEGGTFSDTLYYRLNTVTLEIER